MNQSKFSAIGNSTFQSKMNETTGNAISMITEEERARIDARRIGPFSFDIDDDIDQKLQIKLREAAEPDHGPALDEDSDGFPEAAEK